MVGLKDARIADKGIDQGAKLVESQKVSIDINYGEKLLQTALENIIKDIENI